MFLAGSCEEADVDTKSAPVCGDPSSRCSLWKSKLDQEHAWCLTIATILSDSWCRSLPTVVKFPVSTFAVWWPAQGFPGAFESNLLPYSDLLNFFLFCWSHFLFCKRHSGSYIPIKTNWLTLCFSWIPCNSFPLLFVSSCSFAQWFLLSAPDAALLSSTLQKGVT